MRPLGVGFGKRRRFWSSSRRVHSASMPIGALQRASRHCLWTLPTSRHGIRARCNPCLESAKALPPPSARCSPPVGGISFSVCAARRIPWPCSPEAWLPILHAQHGTWHFTALYSNTGRAHELGRTRDWVVIYYYDGDHVEGQCTVVTETQGVLKGRRVVRGREVECTEHYATVAEAPASASASAAATCSLTATKLSGVTEIESIPHSTRNPANSG
jgi:hypothetical protein